MTYDEAMSPDACATMPALLGELARHGVDAYQDGERITAIDRMLDPHNRPVDILTTIDPTPRAVLEFLGY